MSYLKLVLKYSVSIGFLFSISLSVAENSKPNFIEAKTTKRVAPDYPTSQRAANNAGVVELLMMVRPDGTPFEPMVVHSTKPQFEKAALNVVDDYQFSPAILNGEAVESSYSLRIVFMMKEGADAVSPKFARNYRAARAELEKEEPKREKAEKSLRRLAKSDHLSPYAYAHLSLVNYLYASHFGGLKEQIDAIESMLLFEGRAGSKGKFLDEELRRSMRHHLFALNVQAQRYGDAISAHNALTQIDTQAEQKYKNALTEIRAIRDNDKPVVIDLDIHSRGYTSLDLFKNVFYFSDVKGSLDSIKLRCLNKFIGAPVQLESEYKVPDGPGYCNLQVVGTPGTTFKLVQQ